MTADSKTDVTPPPFQDQPVPSKKTNPAMETGADENKNTFKSFLLPYLIIILAQLPLVVLYFKNLWGRSHYQAFVFGLLALGYFLYLWWPRDSKKPFFASKLSLVLIGIGLLFAFMATIFVTPWFAYFSTICFLGSLLAQTRHSESGKSLLPLVLLLLVFLQPPVHLDFDTVNGDRVLITKLQTISSNVSSHFLDLLGYTHNLSGTQIEMPNNSVDAGVKPYAVEEACSGVQSFFTLLFLTTFFVIILKRPWFRALLLILSAMFWAVIMNTIRIVVIPIADVSFGLNLAEGLPHMIWGYIALVIGVLLVLSTDQLLIFLFGPIDEASESENVTRTGLARFWNRAVAGESDEDDRNKTKRRSISPLFRKALWPIAGAMLLVFLVQSVDVFRSWTQPGVRVRFFDNDQTVIVTRDTTPETITAGKYPWQKFEYRFEDRKRTSDLGQRSDTWIYTVMDESTTPPRPRYRVITSFDQVFPGWHELTTCYKTAQFRMLEDGRRKIKSEIGDSGRDWPIVEAEMAKPTGESGYLLFCLFDRAGDPYDAPGDWNTVSSTLSRIGNRLSHRVRSRLFQGEGYQVQVFVQTAGKLNNADKESILENFKVFRESLRSKFESGELTRPENSGSNRLEVPSESEDGDSEPVTNDGSSGSD